MLDIFSGWIDKCSDFLAERKGLLPLAGLALTMVNLILRFFVPDIWPSQVDLFLHLGVILAILGFLIAPIL